jgi:hypothetical protein
MRATVRRATWTLRVRSLGSHTEDKHIFITRKGIFMVLTRRHKGLQNSEDTRRNHGCKSLVKFIRFLVRVEGIKICS